VASGGGATELYVVHSKERCIDSSAYHSVSSTLTKKKRELDWRSQSYEHIYS